MTQLSNTAKVINENIKDPIRVRILPIGEVTNCVKTLLIESYLLSEVVAEKIVTTQLSEFLLTLKSDLFVEVESPYVDKIYRDAYYNYYSSKLNKYCRDCIRLSFFNKEVTPENFRRFKMEQDVADLKAVLFPAYFGGLKSRKNKGNSESYKQILGSQAQLGVLPSDKYSYTRGHSFGGAFDTILQKDVLLGISTSSKVWRLEDNKIKYFVEWCNNIARKVGDPDMDKLDSPLSELDSGKVVDAFPNLQVFFTDWDAKQYYKLTAIVFLDKDEEPVEGSLICSCDVKVISQTTSVTTIEISKNNTVCKIEYKLNPRATFEYAADTPHKIAIKRGANYGNTTAFLALLNESLLNIFYEDLSKLIGRVLFDFNIDKLRTISDDQLRAHVWPANVNVAKEFYNSDDVAANLAGGNIQLSIHDYIIELAAQDYDVVFYDHGSLEIADVIGLKKGKIQFWHCKKQSGSEPNCSIDDIYEVCGQAVKSVNWANRGLLIKQIYERADQNDSSAKIKKGTLPQIKTILDSFDNPIIPVEITIVQPGLKSTNQTTNQKAAYERIKLLLSGAESFLKDVSSCQLSIMCS